MYLQLKVGRVDDLPGLIVPSLLSIPLFFNSLTFFIARSLVAFILIDLLLSMEPPRGLRGALPGFASGFITHHDDLPAPSFCILMNRLCNDKLCRIEFYEKECNNKSELEYKVWPNFLLKWLRNCLQIFDCNSSHNARHVSSSAMTTTQWYNSDGLPTYTRTEDVIVKEARLVQPSRYWLRQHQIWRKRCLFTGSNRKCAGDRILCLGLGWSKIFQFLHLATRFKGKLLVAVANIVNRIQNQTKHDKIPNNKKYNKIPNNTKYEPLTYSILVNFLISRWFTSQITRNLSTYHERVPLSPYQITTKHVCLIHWPDKINYAIQLP